MVETKQDASAGDLESSISQVLEGTVDLADGARVTLNEDRVVVEITNPRLESNKMWIYETIGTPIASIVASVVAQILDKPVTINSEELGKGKFIVELKVLERNV